MYNGAIVMAWSSSSNTNSEERALPYQFSAQTKVLWRNPTVLENLCSPGELATRTKVGSNTVEHIADPTGNNMINPGCKLNSSKGSVPITQNSSIYPETSEGPSRIRSSLKTRQTSSQRMAVRNLFT